MHQKVMWINQLPSREADRYNVITSAPCSCRPSGGRTRALQPSGVLSSQFPGTVHSPGQKHSLSIPRSFPQLPEFVLAHDRHGQELLQLYGLHDGHRHGYIS